MLKTSGKLEEVTSALSGTFFSSSFVSSWESASWDYAVVVFKSSLPGVVLLVKADISGASSNSNSSYFLICKMRRSRLNASATCQPLKCLFTRGISND